MELRTRKRKPGGGDSSGHLISNQGIAPALRWGAEVLARGPRNTAPTPGRLLSSALRQAWQVAGGRSMKRSGFVLFFACGLYLCGAAGAGAAESAPPTYAVMSLIGDSLTIVIVEKGDTGSRLDQNRHVDVPIKENGFDATVLNALAAGVSKLQPEAAQEVLQTRSPALFRLQDRIFENSDAARGVRASLQALFRERNATQLIIVTKHRAEAQIQFANRTSGIGSLEGLGFYVDSSLQLTNAGTQQLGLGLIAPYMYVSLRLVDAKTMEVIRELPVAKALPLERIGTRDFEGNTWDRLGDAQKVRILEFMIRETIKDTLPKLLAPGS